MTDNLIRAGFDGQGLIGLVIFILWIVAHISGRGRRMPTDTPTATPGLPGPATLQELLETLSKAGGEESVPKKPVRVPAPSLPPPIASPMRPMASRAESRRKHVEPVPIKAQKQKPAPLPAVVMAEVPEASSAMMAEMAEPAVAGFSLGTTKTAVVLPKLPLLHIRMPKLELRGIGFSPRGLKVAYPAIRSGMKGRGALRIAMLHRVVLGPARSYDQDILANRQMFT